MAVGEGEGRPAIVVGGDLVAGAVGWVEMEPTVVERGRVFVEHHVNLARVGDVTHQQELAPARGKGVLRPGGFQAAGVPDKAVHGEAADVGRPAGRPLLLGEKMVT
ncbi:MAG TPA: hypothetical protein EYQ05_05760 [Gammaproteobacteria bacterium]|nr:hypothetical protein [Gammaproteobacteria bacterium]